MVLCTCCQSELTAPTIIDGRPYGYTCAAKISGGKQARKRKFVPCTILKTIVPNLQVLVEYDGIKRREFINHSTGLPGLAKMIDGQLLMPIKR